MTRIIAARYMTSATADQLNTLRQRVQEQLPEGCVAVVIPAGVELFEVGVKEPITHVLAESVDTTKSPAGSEVQHVAGGAQDDGKIRFVWLTPAECTAVQRGMCVGIDDTGPVPKYAIGWEQLTPGQQMRFVDRVSEL